MEAMLNLRGEVVERHPTRRGLHWIFENMIVYSGPDLEEGFHAVLSLHNRQGTRGVGRRMGRWLGVYFGEVPAIYLDKSNPASARILYEWTTIDPKVEKRKKLKKFLRKHPQIKMDLQRIGIRATVNGDVLRGKSRIHEKGRIKKTQKQRTLSGKGHFWRIGMIDPKKVIAEVDVRLAGFTFEEIKDIVGYMRSVEGHREERKVFIYINDPNQTTEEAEATVRELWPDEGGPPFMATFKKP